MGHGGECQLTIRIARSIPEVEEIRGTWMEWQSNPASDIDNYLSMVRLRPEIQRPHVMLVYRDGNLDSILIGRLERAKISCTLGYLKLFQPQVRVFCFAHEGFLGNNSAENSEFVTHEIVKCLSRGEADAARFDYLRTDSTLFEVVQGIPRFFCRDRFAPTQPHGCLRLPGSYEEFVAGLSRKERHNLKRYAARIKADFPEKMRIQTFGQAGHVDTLMRETEEIAKKTYQRGLGVGFQNDPETRQLLQSAAHKGALHACILYLEDRPCAFMIGVRYGQALHGTAMGYDPHFTDYSLGSFILMHWIQQAFESNGSRNISEIDLGPGDGRHKRLVYNHMWNESLVYIFAPTLKGFISNFERTLAYVIDQPARKLLLKTGFLERIKKSWRSRVPCTGKTNSPQAVAGLPWPNRAQSSD